MMKVILADTAITAIGWDSSLDSLGEYKLAVRKTPQELREERERLKNLNKKVKIRPVKLVPYTVIQHDEDDQSVVYFLPGLWPRVKAALEQRHIEYEIEDRRQMSIRPKIDVTQLAGVEFRENQDVALALIENADCGIIETTTGWGKSFLISVICRVFPTLNILVCTSSTSVVNTLCDYLNKALPGQVGKLLAGKDTTAGKRIVVSTLKSLEKIPAENVHLVLVDECHDIGHNKAGQELMRFCFARRFGFSASPIRNDGSQRLLEAICGPVILKMTYEESVEAGMVTPMKYTMLRCNSGPPVCQNKDLPEFLLKRFAYWQNTTRNKVIQQFVYDLKSVYNGQILIVVATLEHAISLHMLLPWFKVAYYGATDMADMRLRFPKEKYPNLDLSQYKLTPKQLDITRNAFAKGTLRYVISTTVFKQGVNFQKLQVLIRADGAVSEVWGIQIPGRLSRLDDEKQYAYLIDIEDSFCPWASRRSACREANYSKQEWIKVSREEVLRDLAAKSSAHIDDTAWVQPGGEG